MPNWTAVTQAIHALMRTAIDLPADLHHAAALIARDRHQTLSRTVADLMRSVLSGGQRAVAVQIDPETGLPLVRFGHRVTTEDVAGAQDEG